MNISDAGLRFIADWEGLRLYLYDDGGPGIGNATIGVGHLVHLGPIDGRASEAPFRNGITIEGAYNLLREDAQRFVSYANSQLRVAVSQNQFDALVDFSFNTGGGYPEVWRAVNGGGDVCAVLRRTAILPAWATAALKRRREAECKLYSTPDPPAQEEEDMKPFLVWDLDRQAMWLIGPSGATWITRADDVAALEKQFGKAAVALHASTIEAFK